MLLGLVGDHSCGLPEEKRTVLHVMLAVAEKGTGNREGIDIIPFHLVRSLV